MLDIGENGAATLVDRPSVFHSTDLQAAIPIQAPNRVGAGPRSWPARAASSQPEVMASINHAADWVNLPPTLIAAVAWQETRYRPGAVSPKGALGVMQLMPATARDLGVDPADSDANIHGGALYLRRMLERYSGDLTKALAAYNAGPGAVDRYAGVPPYRETRRYVASILDRLRAQKFFEEARR